MNKKVIVIDTGSESNHLMMSDVSKLDCVTQISDVYNTNSKFVKTLLRIHFGFKINNYFDFPFKDIWNRKCVLNKMLEDSTNEYYIVLVNDVIRKLSKRYIRKLMDLSRVHVYIVLLDAHEKIKPYFRRCVDRFPTEHIYSFQKSDCMKYGYIYTNTLYSRIALPSEEELFDAYFVGEEKDRMDEIWQLFSKLSSQGISCHFDVITRKSIDIMKAKYPGITFIDHRISYKSILDNIAKSKCIVEICQQGQDGLTMRFYEAVFYNRRLITNNKTARENEFYDDRTMVIYTDPETIDIDESFFVGTVDYHYYNEMSPIHLIDRILEN